MAVNEFWVLLLVVKKAWNNTRKKYKAGKRQSSAETNRGKKKKELLGEFLDGKGAFYNGNESVGSDSDDDNYNENNDHQQLPGGFVNSCYKIVSPVLLLEPNSNSAVCKHCSGTLLLVKNVWVF